MTPELLPLVYTAQSKRAFYCRDAVCEFALRRGWAPLNPFRAFGYFLGDRVERDAVRRANQAVICRADAVWSFGRELADGVLAEVALARRLGKPVRFFTVSPRAEEIVELAPGELEFEDELLGQADRGELLAVVAGERPYTRAVDPPVTPPPER